MTVQRKISPSVSAAFVALGLATAIVALSVVPPSLRPETGLPHGIEHFVIYWATGLAFALGCELKPGLLATLLVFFSGAVEIAQLFVPGRHARLSDFIVDGLAITVGVMAVSLVAPNWRSYVATGIVSKRLVLYTVRDDPIHSLKVKNQKRVRGVSVTRITDSSPKTRREGSP